MSEKLVDLVQRGDRLSLIDIIEKEVDFAGQILSLYEECLGMRIALTRQLSRFMTQASKLDRRLLHTLELINMLGINTKFHKKQTSKAIDILRVLNNKLNDFEDKMETTFDPFTSKYEICENHREICETLLEGLRNKKIKLKTFKNKLLNQQICCVLDLPEKSHRCGDVNNNDKDGKISLEEVDGVLKQSWESDILDMEEKFQIYREHYEFICSLFAIKDDWEEGNP